MKDLRSASFAAPGDTSPFKVVHSWWSTNLFPSVVIDSDSDSDSDIGRGSGSAVELADAAGRWWDFSDSFRTSFMAGMVF